MLNLNRRYAAALERSARADERLATAEEKMARSIGEILREPASESKDRPCKNVTPPKAQTPKRT